MFWLTSVAVAIPSPMHAMIDRNSMSIMTLVAASFTGAWMLTRDSKVVESTGGPENEPSQAIEAVSIGSSGPDITASSSMPTHLKNSRKPVITNTVAIPDGTDNLAMPPIVFQRKLDARKMLKSLRWDVFSANASMPKRPK